MGATMKIILNNTVPSSNLRYLRNNWFFISLRFSQSIVSGGIGGVTGGPSTYRRTVLHRLRVSSSSRMFISFLAFAFLLVCVHGTQACPLLALCRWAPELHQGT